MDLILASQSPRRKELLGHMGVEFKSIPSDFDEQLDDSRLPEEVATELALGKAMAVATLYPKAVVIGADTIVTVDGRQLEKPHDAAEAHDMLRRLSGKPNDVSTGLAVVRLADGVQLTGADTSRVFFKPYDEQAVADYVATGDPLDKAGAYGIQSGAAVLVDHIEGHYDTVVGLPTILLTDFLSRLGIAAKPVELELPIKQLISS